MQTYCTNLFTTMTSPEDEIKDLKEKNNELVLKVQYWKMTAAERENEKLELMKEINDLRLKLSRLRNGGATQAKKLDTALQAASEEALTHLVQASGAVARTIELAKTYMRDRQELENLSPRWSNIGGTPNIDKVHRVPPTMMGGQSIQPVVSLSRTVFNSSNRSLTRSPNNNRSVSAVPMHMLQDLYIPLTRIDANEQPGNNFDANIEDNGLDSDSSNFSESSDIESMNDTQNELEGDYDGLRRLDALVEDMEPEQELLSPQRNRTDNPLEGPSWLLDAPPAGQPKVGSSLEPDSTTEPEAAKQAAAAEAVMPLSNGLKDVSEGREFTPTVRRRKRITPLPRDSLDSPIVPPSPPPTALEPPPSAPPPSPPSASLPSPPSPSPQTASRPNCRRANGGGAGRELKVLVAKMRLEAGADAEAEAGAGAEAAWPSPPSQKRPRPLSLDAPSPNGSTSAAVVVSDSSEIEPFLGFADCRNSRSHDNRSTTSHDNRSTTSQESRDSDARDDARPRRPRKPVTYKEKPLNRKMRR